MDVFGQTYLDSIKRGLKWFLETDQVGKDGLTFDLDSNNKSYVVTIKISPK